MRLYLPGGQQYLLSPARWCFCLLADETINRATVAIPAFCFIISVNTEPAQHTSGFSLPPAVLFQVGCLQ